MAIKISKVIADLNVGRQTIEEFLHKKGIKIDASINARIQDDVYQMLVREFKPDSDLKSKSEKMIKERLKQQAKQKAAVKESHEIKTIIPGSKHKQARTNGKNDLASMQSSADEKKREDKPKQNTTTMDEINLVQGQFSVNGDLLEIKKEKHNQRPTEKENIEDSQINKGEMYYRQLTDLLSSYDRFTPSRIVSLKPHQIFVFGTDQQGSQRYGAAGIAAEKFGAQHGIIEGPTGSCYALPTKGFSVNELSKSVARFEHYVRHNSNSMFLVTAVGCGHAGFDVNEVAHMFQGMIGLNNVMLPREFIEVYRKDCREHLPTVHSATSKPQVKTNAEHFDNTILQYFDESLHNVVKYLLVNNIVFNHDCGFTLTDANGVVIAEAELGIEQEKIVFLPFNSQSEIAFKNSGYIIYEPEEYLKTKI